jgi:amidophosphoribosyltransferase
VDEVREIIGCDALIYQDVEGMKRAVLAASRASGPRLDGFDASCFDGLYVTGDICAEDIARINEARIGQEDALEEDTSRLALPNAQEA